MANLIIVIVILVIVAAAVVYIVKEKKKGTVCIGCPAAGTCGSKGNPSETCSAMGDVDRIVEQIKESRNTEK